MRAVTSMTLGATGIAAVLALTGCSDDKPVAQAAAGEQLFQTNCSACHGPDATGTSAGPPLVHEIYEPGHHADDAFRNAVANGVAPHHWDFGPMPPVPDLDADEVEAVIAYVRDLQRQAGIN